MRVAYQGLAAVLGGTQSLHTNSMDETLALPTEKAVTIALRTQQILAWETGVANTIDPLAGSYYVEALTDRLEAEAEEIFERVERQGGVVPGIENGWFQREIASSAARQQAEIEAGLRTVVGVNRFTGGSADVEIDTLQIDPEVERRQRERMARLRAERGRREGGGGAGTAARRGCGRRQHRALHPGLREGLLHAIRDQGGHGRGLRRLPGAGLLLAPQDKARAAFACRRRTRPASAPRRRNRSQPPEPASSNPSMSIFPILRRASMTRFGSRAINSPMLAGMTCQETPKRSSSQPQ